jgi:hypothetical protein
LEELKGKKGSQGGRFFFLNRREVTKWTRIQDTKNMMNTIETPLSFFATTSSKAISQQGCNLVNIIFITISSSI